MNKPTPSYPNARPGDASQVRSKTSKKTYALIVILGIALFFTPVILISNFFDSFGHDDIVSYTEKTYETISVPVSWTQSGKSKHADPIDIGAADTGWNYMYTTSGSNTVDYQDLRYALAADEGEYVFDTSESPDVLVAKSEKSNLRLTATFTAQSVEVEVRELHVEE